MNTYFLLLQYLKTIFEQDRKVNTVFTGDWEQWKKDLFPIVHIEINESPFTEQVTTANTRYSVEITAADIRDVNKEDVKDKFWHQDNRHENWNTTRGILKRATIKLIKDLGDTNITLESASSANKLTWAYMNGMDGWSQTFIIDVPDREINACDTGLTIVSTAFGSETPPLGTFTIAFSDTIELGTGNLVFIDSNGDINTTISDSDMTIVGNDLVVDLTGTPIDSLGSGEFYIRLSSNIVTSESGLSFAGITDNSYPVTIG